MGYLDIWIYDSRPRVRVFLCYALIFIGFFIFSDLMIYGYTKTLYKPMTSYEVNITSPEVTVQTAEASNVNGNVKGTIKNTTDENIENKYLKFDFYTPRDINVGTKYIKIDNLSQGEEKAYEVGFRYDNVTYVKISMIDESEAAKATPEELEINPVYGPAGLISGVILGYFFL